MAPLPPQGITLHGGCDCCGISYTITIPALSLRPISFKDETTGEGIRFPQSFLDHCNRCRRVSGAIIPAWITVPQDWVEWTQMSTSNKAITSSTREIIKLPSDSELSLLPVTNYVSSPGVVRSFCGRCGTNLAFVNLERDMESDGKVATVDIVLRSLDRESLEVEGVRPDRHTYWDSGVEWVKRLVTEGDGALNEVGKVPRHPDGDRDVVV